MRYVKSVHSLNTALFFSFDASDFLLLEQECFLHGRTTASVHSRLWTRGGRLLASSSHENAIETIALQQSHKSATAKL